LDLVGERWLNLVPGVKFWGNEKGGKTKTNTPEMLGRREEKE